MSHPLRVGFIGAGANTRERHIPGLAAIDGVELAAVCNRSVASAQKVCDAFNIPRATDRAADLFADDTIDAIVIGTWPDQHAPLTIAALEAGKHVMCEARMATDAPSAEAMLHASQRRPDLVAQVVPSPFTLTLDAAIRRCLADRLGTLRSVRIEILPGVVTDRPRPATWRLRRCYSGNNIMSVGIWVEAMMRWVGPVAELTAELTTAIPEGVAPATGQPVAIDVPDHVEAVGRLASGAAWSLIASTVVPADPSDAGVQRQRILLTGDAGTLHVEMGQATFHPAHGSPEPLTSDPSAGWRVEADFVDAIRDGTPITLTDFATGLQYMRFTDALHESHRLGVAVRVS
ncbi:MAG: Gfo/Idh/MocA family oxidoreductase [Planctomycetota bacterium]